MVIKRSGRSGDEAYGVQFLFKYRGKVYTDIFTVSMYSMTRKQWRDKGYEDSPSIVLYGGNGRLFAYYTPEEPPDEFFDNKSKDGFNKKYSKQLNLLRRMINDDVPKIAKTFKPANYKPRKIVKAR
ncbi:hypothetical protein [Paenibacillus sp. Soil750]|uniref:hypothetical protein n=1 Tax=Paenibacillus sp. Soil750 TaxID=1736398 RepID=UPI0006FE4FC9|nr:hypothetical protein [Paenibacillus sp. Soil750]